LDGKKGWWVVFGAAWALTITAGVGFSSMGVLKDSIIVDMGWSETEYMAGITYFGLSSAIFSPFIGKAIDIFGSRWIMFIGIVIAAGAQYGLSYVTTLNQFYGALSLLAVGIMSCSYIPVAAIVGRWFVKHAAIATGVSMLGIGIGGGLFPMITQALLKGQGYQSAFAILSGVMLTALIPVAIFVRPPNRETREAAETGEEGAETDGASGDLTLLQALKTRSFWGLNMGDLLTGMVFAIFNAALVSYITEDTGDADLATKVFSVFGLGLGFGIIVFGPLGQIFNFRRVFALCYFLPSVGTAILAISSEPVAAYTFAVIAGFAGGGRSALFPAAILKSFGGTHMASIYGVSNTLFMFGVAGGPLIAGALLDATGKTMSIYIFGVFAFVVSTFLVSLIRDERGPAGEAPEA